MVSSYGYCWKGNNWPYFVETSIRGHKSVIRFGFVIVDDSKRGKGYGRQMLRFAIDYAQQQVNYQLEFVALGQAAHRGEKYTVLQVMHIKKAFGTDMR